VTGQAAVAGGWAGRHTRGFRSLAAKAAVG
jgi:hypothetical protein